MSQNHKNHIFPRVLVTFREQRSSTLRTEHFLSQWTREHSPSPDVDCRVTCADSAVKCDWGRCNRTNLGVHCARLAPEREHPSWSARLFASAGMHSAAGTRSLCLGQLGQSTPAAAAASCLGRSAARSGVQLSNTKLMFRCFDCRLERDRWQNRALNSPVGLTSTLTGGQH